MRLVLSAPVLSALALAAATLTAQTTATLSIDASHPSAQVSPTLYGIMSEEINHAWDGGLYAELISNRAPQPPRRPGRPAQNWILIEHGSSEAALAVDSASGPSAALPASLKLDVTSADTRSTAGFFNTGYWGIAVRPSTTYRGSFYAKSDTPALAPSPSVWSKTKPERLPRPPLSLLSTPTGSGTRSA